jgi:hypothetical protein
MQGRKMSLMLVTALIALTSSASAQTFTVDDPVLMKMWEVGMEQSRARRRRRSPWTIPYS